MINRRLTRCLGWSVLGVAFVGSYASMAMAQGQRPSPTASRTETAYPTGDRATSVILLERFTPTEVRVGEAYSYEVKLTNLTSAKIQDIVLTEQVAVALDVTEILPAPDSRDGHMAVWELGKLNPGQSKTIKISGSSNGTGSLESCAQVTFSMGACSVTKVVQPELSLTKTAPAEVVVCDPIPLKFVVTNSGSGVAHHVMVTDRLPVGWTTSDGGSELAFDAGDLAAGQSREFSATVKSARTGGFVNTANATEAGGLTTRATAETLVRQPVLAVTKAGPAFRYIGRPAKFEVTVTNQGDAPATNAILIDTLPAAVDFVSASDNGTFAAGKVSWNLGTIAVGESKIVNVTLKPNQAGTIRNAVVAQAYCAEANASAALEVRGIPAVLLEVIDVHDPIEIGNRETYEIKVLNQGSADGTNIVIACTLPPEEQYVSASGPTDSAVVGRTITFEPLKSARGEGRGDIPRGRKGHCSRRCAFQSVSDQRPSRKPGRGDREHARLLIPAVGKTPGSRAKPCTAEFAPRPLG